MHADEAVHADKFGTLLEQGVYQYSPHEFHGPALNHLTMVPAWFRGTRRYVDIDEATMRVVPAWFGILLVFLHWWVRSGLGNSAAVAAAVLAALSPAMVFYSRYYIQEMLLVCFSFGAIICGGRYVDTRKVKWAAAAGICLGLMHASKETCVIAVASMLVAAGLTLISTGRGRPWWKKLGGVVAWKHALLVLAVSLGVSGLLFSSFLTNLTGIPDSFFTYRNYVERAMQNPWHIHPWHYYLQTLSYFREGHGPVWSEGFILLLAVVGFASALRRKGLPDGNHYFVRFVGFYTVTMVVVYSSIAYKTPWCLLGFLHGMILLAGVGMMVILRSARRSALRVTLAALSLAGLTHLGWQAYQGSFRYASDPCNPYVYAHTGTDVFMIRQRLEQLAAVHPDGRSVPIQIITRQNLWPLPWYLRSFTRVGWWNGVADHAATAPVILATPDMEPALIRKLYELPPPGEREMYLWMFDRYVELRPGVEVRGYVAKTLWDRDRESKP